MKILDVLTLGFYFFFRKIYYKNETRYLGFGAEEHAVSLSAFSCVLLFLVGFDIFNYWIHGERWFNEIFGIVTFMLIFILFFIVYLGKKRLTKILSKKYKMSTKIVYSSVSMITLISLFWLFTWGSSYLSWLIKELK